jgi:NADH-quinone oxidoreductase subunit M
MLTLHFPWLELAILLPLLGAGVAAYRRDGERSHVQSVCICGLTLVCVLSAWLDFGFLHTFEAHDRWDLWARWLGKDVIVIDELSAPLLPLTALLFFLTSLMTLRTKRQRFSFAGTLLAESLLLATLSCKHPVGVVALLAVGTLPPFFELQARRKPTRVYVFHMALFVGLLILGQAVLSAEEPQAAHSLWGMGLLVAAVLLRSGIVPVHCWMTDLFEHATFATALLFVTPMVGAYAAMRLVLPIAPDWMLRGIALLSLWTAVYAAGMALVQREARRFFCYLFLSHSSLVLIGLEAGTPIALTGALSVWLSVGLSLTGFGLTLRALESRVGRMSLDHFHGLYDHTPTLAAFFLLTGLASVGFPGTFGFIGTELLVDGAVQVYPSVGMAVVVATGLNGIAILQAFFRLFTGAKHVSSLSLRVRSSERWAVFTLTLLILGGGLFPQPGIESRFHAAVELLSHRHLSPAPETPRTTAAMSHPDVAGNRDEVPQPNAHQTLSDGSHEN